MTFSEFFGKFKSRYLWGNLAAIAATWMLLAVGVKYGIDVYTHHGEAISVPNLTHKNFDDAKNVADHLKLKIEVVDTGYVKHLPAGCILEQSPGPGETVKAGHAIYVTINAGKSPTIKLPDVIDNSSLREAMAKLTAMGFKLTLPQFISGEKYWVYGILANGKPVSFGDRIPVDAKLTIQVGNGMRDMSDSVNYVDPVYPTDDEYEEMGETDPFEEVSEPPIEEKQPFNPTNQSPDPNRKQSVKPAKNPTVQPEHREI